MWGNVTLTAGNARAATHTLPALGQTAAPATATQAIAPQAAAQWARIRHRLQADVGDVEYRSWFRQMTLGCVEGDEVTVHLPSRFLRDWVRSNYGEKITAFWQQENASIRRVEIRIKEGSWEVAAYEANRRAVKAVRPDVAVMGSGDEHLMTSWLIGSEGSQVSLAAVVPEAVVALWEAAQAGDWDRARHWNDVLYPLAVAIYRAAPGGRATSRLKACLRMLGRIPGRDGAAAAGSAGWGGACAAGGGFAACGGVVRRRLKGPCPTLSRRGYWLHRLSSPLPSSGRGWGWVPRFSKDALWPGHGSRGTRAPTPDPSLKKGGETKTCPLAMGCGESRSPQGGRGLLDYPALTIFGGRTTPM